MDPIYSGAITGFVLGTLGYTMVRFVIRPIFSYKKVKRRIVSTINDYLNLVHNEIENPNIREKIEESIRVIREQAQELSSCYENVLPVWYRILLKRRGEIPIEACKHLVMLSNTREYKHAQNRTEKIKQTLGL